MAPRRKDSDAAPGRITCPACRSSISSDGAALYERSKRLDALEETEGGLEEINKNLAELEKELKALRAENVQLKSRPAAAPPSAAVPPVEDKDAQLKRR